MMAGYSGTPLMRKLGLAAGMRVAVMSPPADYRTLLGPEADSLTFAARLARGEKFVHLFESRRSDLAKRLATLRNQLADDGTLWVSWPKKQPGVNSDITENTIRALALPLGFVDVKVCAIDDTWSALKLVVRRELRGTAASEAQ